MNTNYLNLKINKGKKFYFLLINSESLKEDSFIFFKEDVRIPVPFGTKGFFDEKHYLRIFFSKEECRNYVGPNLINAIKSDLNSGNSFLNYQTFSGKFGSKKSSLLKPKLRIKSIKGNRFYNFRAKNICNLILDFLTTKSIETNYCFKKDFKEKDPYWFNQIYKKVKVMPNDIDYKSVIKIKKISKSWGIKKSAKFLIKHSFINLDLKFDINQFKDVSINFESYLDYASKKIF